METNGYADFIPLNGIILKACQPDIAKRYQSTAEMLLELRNIPANTPNKDSA